MSSTTHYPAPRPAHGPDATRRDVLTLMTLSCAAIGGAAIAWTLVDSLNPAADVIAAGAPIDIDVTKIAPGQQIIVRWRAKPILVVHRTADMLRLLQSNDVTSRLSDPNSQVNQQPSYAQNWHRSIKPEFAVLVGICTHLGCLPGYLPKPDPTQPVTNWPGGYFCPCHGSKFDLAGRVFQNVPAPYNLAVPPYVFSDEKTLRVGANPAGSNFELSQVVQE